MQFLCPVKLERGVLWCKSTETDKNVPDEYKTIKTFGFGEELMGEIF